MVAFPERHEFHRTVVFVHIHPAFRVLGGVHRAFACPVVLSGIDAEGLAYQPFLMRQEVFCGQGHVLHPARKMQVVFHHVGSQRDDQGRIAVDPGEPVPVDFVVIRLHVARGFVEGAEVQLLRSRLRPPERRGGLVGRGYPARAEHGVRLVEGKAQLAPIAPAHRPLLDERLPVHDEPESASGRPAGMPFYAGLSGVGAGKEVLRPPVHFLFRQDGKPLEVFDGPDGRRVYPSFVHDLPVMRDRLVAMKDQSRDPFALIGDQAVVRPFGPRVVFGKQLVEALRVSDDPVLVRSDVAGKVLQGHRQGKIQVSGVHFRFLWGTRDTSTGWPNLMRTATFPVPKQASWVTLSKRPKSSA